MINRAETVGIFLIKYLMSDVAKQCRLGRLRISMVHWGVVMSFVLAQPPGVQGQSPREMDLPVEAYPLSFEQVIAYVRPSIVAVGSYYFKDTPTVRYVGTGFVVGDGNTVVTNAHVVDALVKLERVDHLRVYFPDDQLIDGRQAKVWAVDRFHDLAVIRYTGSPAPVLSLDPSAPPQGRSVGILGYPIGLRLGLVPAAHRGVVAAVVPAVLPLPRGAKMNMELAEAIREPYNLYQLDMVVYPGNSGSPLFDSQRGQVIGIINKTLATKTREHLLTEPSAIAYAVPTRWIQELLVRGASMSESDRNKELKRLGVLGD